MDEMGENNLPSAALLTTLYRLYFRQLNRSSVPPQFRFLKILNLFFRKSQRFEMGRLWKFEPYELKCEVSIFCEQLFFLNLVVRHNVKSTKNEKG